MGLFFSHSSHSALSIFTSIFAEFVCFLLVILFVSVFFLLFCIISNMFCLLFSADGNDFVFFAAYGFLATVFISVFFRFHSFTMA